jgi:hypothetical protein
MRLLLADQLMLLAFSPGNGRLRMGARSHLGAGLGGAVLTELALRGSIAMEPGRRPAGRLRVRPLGPLAGEPFLDAMAARIQAAKPRTLTWWIRRGLADVHGQVLARLTGAGVVTTTGTLRRHSYLVYPQARDEAVARLQLALLTDPARVAGLWAADPWSASLASLAFACRVLEIGWLPRDHRRLAKANLRVIRGADPIGQAVSAVVEQARRSQTATVTPVMTITSFG